MSSLYFVRELDDIDCFAPHLFLRSDFNEYQSVLFGKKLTKIGVYSAKDESLQAFIVLAGRDGIWTSPITGGFGGVVNSRKIQVDALEALMLKVPSVISSHSLLKSIKVRLAPTCFPDASPILANIMFRNGWNLTDFDINFHLEPRSIDEFMTDLGETKRKFIRRLSKLGATFREVSDSSLLDVYRVIEANRMAQGYPMTMSLESVDSLVKKFSSDVRLFTVSQNEKIIASAICLMLNSRYLYVFYWGELPESRRDSPVILLAHGIVDYCIRHRINIMDIGTSTVDSLPNSGLCNFKSSLGCKTSQKLTYMWTV